jgi:putative addiction module component (TIGR02574 family)
MTSKAIDVLRRALGLSAIERARIAASLLESVSSQSVEGIDASWSDEIKRRIDEIDRGEIRLVGAAEVLRSMYARLN